MNRTQIEREYWDKASKDPDVEIKYICEFEDLQRIEALGKLQLPVLDLGCGTGRLMKPYYHGTDISPKMLELAKKNQPKCSFHLTDGRSLPFPRKFFYSVYSVLMFQHIPFDGFKQYVKEVSRVLRPNGTFVFQYIPGTESEQFSHHYDTKQVKQVLKDNGLNIKSTQNGLVHHLWSWVKAEKMADY